MWHASILVRALVHGWRHMGGAHTPVEGVAAALESGLDSCDSPSALSVSRAHSTDQAALEEPLRCSEPYASKAPAVACSDHGRSVRVNRAVGPVDAHSSEEVQDHHSRRSSSTEHNIYAAQLSSKNQPPL